jgi:DNA-binding NarL/FixJ family response regulator
VKASNVLLVGFSETDGLQDWLYNLGQTGIFKFSKVVHDVSQVPNECEQMNCSIAVVKLSFFHIASDALRVFRNIAVRVLLVGAEAELTNEKLTSLMVWGAFGVVKSSASGATLGRALRAVASGYPWFARRILSRVIRDSLVHAEHRTLSPREREILLLIANGMSNPEISTRSGLSDSTVRWHVANLYLKTGIRNRTRLAAHAPRFLEGMRAMSPKAFSGAGLLSDQLSSVVILQQGLSSPGLFDFARTYAGAVVAGCPTELEQIIAFLRKFDAPVALLDQQLVKACLHSDAPTQLKTEFAARVVVLVAPAFSTKEARFLIGYGCGGFVRQDALPSTLARAVNAVARGEMWLEWSLMGELIQERAHTESNFNVSVREMEILKLIGNGLSNKRVAGALFISTETLRWHLRRLYAKTGACDRLALQRLGIELAARPPAPGVKHISVGRSAG